jgi:glycosyltransferase involved in cell wall biosynthesis
MKIINIVPGFGGTFYCGNCLRDSAFVTSLRNAGHDATILPVYLPLTLTKEFDQKDTPVFYGAVNIYLKQQFPIFRKMPGWMEHFFNSPPILKFASSKAGSTRADGMEALTESMLLGKEGLQSKELQELVNYLKHHAKPDVIHFSNALLIGMAEQIKQEVGVPVVCSLQDEDVWVDAMKPEYRDIIWKLIADKGEGIDAFIAVSDFYAGVMKQKINIPDEKLHVVHIGVDPALYEFSLPATNPRAIGYLSRICEENGFEIVVDAFIQVKQLPGFNDLRLKATGGNTGDDKPFIRKQMKKLKEGGLEGYVDIQEDFTLEGVKQFLRSVTLVSVPVLKGEAFGLYQIEALASGIPILQPSLGAFPEIVKTTGGGAIFHPNTSVALAEKMAEMVSDPEMLNTMSRSGRKAVEEKFDCGKLTADMISVYKSVRK